MSLASSVWPRILLPAALGVAAVFACGPFFGIEVLRDRQQVLLAPPTVSFETELKALVPPPTDKLPVVEGSSETLPNRATVEASELPPAVLARVTDMWTQSSGASAYGRGQGLPPAILLYTTGAVSFSHGETAAAQTFFQDIVALSSGERKSRELWACFMLGRIALQRGNQPAAAAEFEAVRALVRQGALDALGLAVASFGEEARGAWRQGAIAQAVELYARQAAYGSAGGANSLVTIAGLMLNDRKLLDQAVTDPRTLRLLFIYLNGNAGRRFFVQPQPDLGPAAKLDSLLRALHGHAVTEVPGAGLLASAAYAQGRFDTAQKLAVLEDGPVSSWVKAKLALRKGDRSAALREYERALATFQPAMGDATGMRMEFAVLKVSRGEYVQALDLFYAAAAKGDDPPGEWSGFAGYWGDAAYLAERVLTVEELRNYLDHRAPGSSGPAGSGAAAKSRLRSLLARRFMRAGRYRAAVGYFDDPKIRSAAERYAAAIDQATSWWRPRLTRAEAWFTAATLARQSGMDLLGFEKEPDFALWDGEFTPFNSPKPPGLYQTADERQRVAASKPARDVRFQYRLTAVDEAMRSADLLPARSQAFAAVLCQATGWIIDREPARAQRIYQRYLHQGRFFAWGRSFGRTCPAPDFAAASSWHSIARQINRLSRHARAHRVTAVFCACAVVAGPAALLFYLSTWRRRRLHAAEP